MRKTKAELEAQIEGLEDQVIFLSNERDAALDTIWDQGTEIDNLQAQIRDMEVFRKRWEQNEAALKEMTKNFTEMVMRAGKAERLNGMYERVIDNQLDQISDLQRIAYSD